MAKVSKRFLDRAKTHLRRYQKILESARTRDVGESDTVVIVTDFLSDVLGFDKYQDVTTEFAVKSTFCDLAIRVGGELRYLIEVKSVGTGLKSLHLNYVIAHGNGGPLPRLSNLAFRLVRAPRGLFSNPHPRNPSTSG